MLYTISISRLCWQTHFSLGFFTSPGKGRASLLLQAPSTWEMCGHMGVVALRSPLRPILFPACLKVQTGQATSPGDGYEQQGQV